MVTCLKFYMIMLVFDSNEECESIKLELCTDVDYIP